MKFLIKQDWENLLNKLSFNKNNSPKETPVEKLFFEISQRIKDLSSKANYDHTTYGIAMTLFHYYICFNDIRNVDRIEISFACLYMSSKIQFRNISLNKFIEEYKNYSKSNSGVSDKKPDFIKYEVQLYSQLGYDLDIETPFQFFYNDFFCKLNFNNNKEFYNKMIELKNFCFNLINDTYSRPLSIYYHPKIIYLSCLIFSLKFLDYKEFEINSLIKNENVDLIAECMEKIYHIYSRYIEDNSTKNNNNNNNTININNENLKKY